MVARLRRFGMLKPMANPLDETPTLVMDTLTGDLIDISTTPLSSVSPKIVAKKDAFLVNQTLKGLLLALIWFAYLWVRTQPHSDAMVPFIVAPLITTGFIWGVIGVGVAVAITIPVQLTLFLVTHAENSATDYLFSTELHITLLAIIAAVTVGWLSDTRKNAIISLAEAEHTRDKFTSDLAPLLSTGEELVILINESGTVLSHTTPSKGIFAKLSSSAAGAPLAQLLWPGVASVVQERAQVAQKERRQRATETTLVVGKESLVLQITAIPHGKHRTLITIQDISKYRHKETTLRRAKERFALAIEGAKDGMWDWNLLSGEVYWSHRWREIFQIEEQHVRGRVSDWLTRLHKQDRDRVEAEISAQLASDGSHFESEHRIVIRSGEQRWMLARGVMLRNGKGEVTRVAGSFTDITDRRTTALTQEKSALLEHATHAIGVGIAIISPNNRLTNVSPTLRVMQGDWPNANAWWDDIRDTITAPSAATCNRCGKQERLGTCTVEALSPVGRMQVFEIVFTGHGHEVTTEQPANVLLVRDITRRMVAEEHLRRLNAQLVSTRDEALAASRAKSTFLANMSHELRTPLNAILGYTEMLMEEIDEVEPGSQTVQDLQKVHGAGAHLLQLIGGVLDLSKIEAGRMEFTIEQFHVRDLIDDVVSTIKPLIETGGNTLYIDVDEEVGSMRADMTKLRQILLNLLSNASKFTTDGDIRLTVKEASTPSGTFMNMLVSDTGIGITEESQARLFEEFFQVDATATRKHDGTGLGLAISRRFCLLMGGDITLESESGVGTTFTVSLPIDAEIGKLKEPEMPIAGITPRKSSILTLDSHTKFSDQIRHAISGDGLSILVGNTVSESITLAFQHKPALIIANPNLPSEEGYCIIEQLRTVGNLTLVPLIALCAVDRDLDYNDQSQDQKAAPEILLFDRDPSALQPLAKWLTEAGWRVNATSQASEAVRGLSDEDVGLLILSVDPRSPDDLAFVADQVHTPPILLHLKPGPLTSAVKHELEKLKKLEGTYHNQQFMAQLHTTMQFYLKKT
jgi:PAS domain S-box-containing protein